MDRTDQRGDLLAAGGAAGKAALVGVGGFVAYILWFSVLLSFVEPAVGTLSDVQRTVLGALSLGFGTGTAALLYIRATDRDLGFVDLELPSKRDVAYAVGGVLGLFATMIGIQVLFSLVGASGANHGLVETARQNPQILLVLIPASWLIIGPGEELLFRNVVQKSLYDQFRRPVAVVVASAVFASVHLPAYSGQGTTLQQTLVSLTVVFVLALILGGLYVRTDNLTVPVFVHGTFNAVQFADLYVRASSAAGETAATLVATLP